MSQNKKYNVVFISNYLNHHQIPFSQEMMSLTGGSYLFIATTPTPKGRLKLGYRDANSSYDFVLRAYESKESFEKAKKYALDADIVLYGSIGRELIKERLKKKKLTFRCTERLFKIEPKKSEMLGLKIRNYFANAIHKNFYLLCEGGYVAEDYKRVGSFKSKSYKWGYFPELKEYDDIDNLISEKEENSLLWAGRMIDWKHPEYAIEVAKRLKAEGYKFKMNVIGTGNLYVELVRQVFLESLDDCVFVLGAMSPEKVREYMEKSQIFLATSDRQEGWGAVINEAMNSGCVVVANENIGAVPYLLTDKENGYIYQNDSIDELYIKTKKLLDNKSEAKRLGKNAYQTMLNEWNAKVAAGRLLALSEELKKNKRSTQFKSGPCAYDLK
ncbi:MAG: glycosyltransferase [Ruminococcaceae bacterium]|nr:glycosyltransferase [Oscillospiraceae bacterium]